MYSPSNPTPLPEKKSKQLGLKQAYEIRQVAADAIKEAKQIKDLTARARALRDLCSVWNTACDRIRVFKGRPTRPQPRPRRARKNPAKPKPDGVSGQSLPGSVDAGKDAGVVQGITSGGTEAPSGDPASKFDRPLPDAPTDAL